MVAVLEQVARRIAATGAEIDREHRLDAGQAAPVDELVGAERVGLGRHPGEVEAPGPLGHRADAVFPIVAGDEVAARIAHDGGPELAHQLQHVLPKAAFVGTGMTGLEDAAIDAAAQMLDEGAEQSVIGSRDGGIAIEVDLCGKHATISVHDASRQASLPCRSAAASAPRPAGSGASTELLSRIE